jgi:hypothetical protein
MVLADPRRMEADLIGVDRLVEDVGDELVGAAPVVGVMVVAQDALAQIGARPQRFRGFPRAMPPQ